jgi:hypothetical protein
MLDHLYLEGTAPQITSPAEENLLCPQPAHRPHLIDAIDSLAISSRTTCATTGELLHDLTLDYQPTGQPPGPARRNPRKHNDSEP